MVHEPAGQLPPELVAVVLALAGVRRGDVVLDLAPSAGLTAGAAAAAGTHGTVLVRQAENTPLPAGATASFAEVEEAVSAGLVIGKVLLAAPETEARSLAPLLLAVRPLLAPGARVTVASRSGGGAISDGLPSVLAGCGLVVAHAEGLQLGGGRGRVALAVGRPAGAG